MSWSFTIGKLFGSEIRVHATFLLLLVWIGSSAWLSSGLAAALLNVLFILALFACVVAHEFGHALMARRFGIKTPDITLLPIGGMARLEKIPEDPRQEISVALAGPAVNVIIWAVLTIVIGFGADMTLLTQIDDPGQGFFERLAAVNLFLVIFNLIPAFPMDGGRVLRAVLAMWSNRARATKVAAAAGQMIAFVFGYLGLVTGNPLLLLIAVFVFLAAMAENSDVAIHDLASGYLCRDAVITAYESLEPNNSMTLAEAALLRTTQAEFPVLDTDGKLMGVLTKAAILANASAKAPTQEVLGVMHKSVPAVELTDPLVDAIDALQKSEIRVVSVTDKAGRFIGYITTENIGEWMLLNRSATR